MRIWILPFLLWFWAGDVVAQTVQVRAGEHETFTRLVFDFPERADFELQRSSGEAVLKFARKGLRFDTTRVFQRVPKTRLTNIEGNGKSGTVRLSLACNCAIKTFWYGASSLVVDIRNPEIQQDDGSRVEPVAATSHSASILPALSQTELVETEIASARRKIAAQQFVRALPVETLSERPFEALNGTSVLPRDQVRKGRASLLRELARAASQGLVSPRKALPRSTRSGAASDPTLSEKASAPEGAISDESNEPPQSSATPNIQLHAQTGFDRDIRKTMLAEVGVDKAEECPDQRKLDVTQWGNEDPFWAQLGPMRSRLVGEFDRPNIAAVKDLARLYIYFGFGAEARQTLVQFGLTESAKRESFETGVLLDLATILDRGTSDQAALRTKFLDCGPMPALWAALSQSTLPNNRPLDADAILRGFSALPPHLRAQLGPQLARRFREAGYIDESDQVRRILKRNETSQTPEAGLLEAKVALDEGQTKSAETHLEGLIGGNAEPSARALLTFIDERLARGAEVSYDLAQLAGAYAMEYRNDELGRQLSHAYVMALAASGAFDQAFQELFRLVGTESGHLSPVLSELMLVLAQRGDDFEFLKHTLGMAQRMMEDLDPEAVNEIARRLLSLGFPEVASKILESDVNGTPTRERKLLRAAIALELNQLHQTELELRGIAGRDADQLRGLARSMAGDHSAARAFFQKAGNKQKEQRQAWLDGDWKALSEHDNETLSAIARMKLVEGNQLETQYQENETLSYDRKLIAKSSELRELLSRLLTSNNLFGPEMLD